VDKISEKLNIQGKFPEIEISFDANNVEVLTVKPSLIREFVSYIKKDFDMLMSLSGAELAENIVITYYFLDSKTHNQVVVQSKLSKESPEIDTLSDIYSSANWHERETYDLLGVVFNNHPNLTRILLPNDWKGHPLRKNYVNNDERLVWNER